MAVPTNTANPGTISTSAEGNGVLIPVNTSIPDGVLTLRVSGTYGTAVLVVRARIAGVYDNADPTVGVYGAVSGVDAVANTAVGTGGSITLTDNTTYTYVFPAVAYDYFEVYCSSLASGAVVVSRAFTPPSKQAAPVVNATTTTTGLSGATTITSTSASALAVGANGATNPVLSVNAATGSVATGLTVIGAAAASGVALTVISSGTNENLAINAKGSGTLSLNATATGTVSVGADLTMADAKNVVVNATTGTKIGTATTQKLGFYNATPVVQPATNTDTTTGAAGGTTTVFLNTTWVGAGGTAGYTIGGVVTALKRLGLLAA